MADETTEAAPAEPLTTAESTELADLRGEMADTKGARFSGDWHDHYYHNEAKQARALELIDREAGGVVASPTATAEPVSEGTSAPLAGRAPGAEEAAASHGLSADSWQVGQDIAADIDAAFGATAAEINTSVGGLPDTLRSGMLRELSSPYLPQQGEAERADVAIFEATAHGILCAGKWGSDTPRRLAIALYRTERFEDALSDADLAEWQGWFSGLQPAEKTAVLDRLTA